MALSPRLHALHDGIRAGYPCFDLACDHGMLGIAALLSDRVPFVTFVDKVPAIIDALSDRFPVVVDRSRASFICADAATLTVRPISGTVVIAGVGYGIAAAILRSFVLPSLTPGARVLVQPESRAALIADDLREEGLTVVEREVVDNGTAHVLLFGEL